MQHELENVFMLSRHRLTKPRIEVFNALKESGGPMSVSHIAKACYSIDKVSAYRTIKLFGELGVVSSVAHGWKQLYELSSPFAPHHHHLICSVCGSMTEVHSDKIENLINDMSKDYNFTPSSHHFEITGVCNKCL